MREAPTRDTRSEDEVLGYDDFGLPSPFGFLRGTVIGQDDIVEPDDDSWRMS